MSTITPAQDRPLYRDVDVVVAGSGVAGVAAAITAARNGARTVLLERYGRLGGCATTSLVCTLFGGIRSRFVQEFEQRYRQVGRHWDLIDVVFADMLQEAGVEILLHTWAFEAIKESRKVCGVRTVSKQGVLDLRAKVVVDATADADIAAQAGAAFEYGRTKDGLVQPMTIMYRVGGVDKHRGFLCGSEHTAHQVKLAEGTWHEIVMKACTAGRLPKNVGIIRIYEAPSPGERLINATQVNHVNGLDIADLTRAELEGRRQAMTITDFLREKAPGYEHCFISQMPAAVGVRETRRVLGVSYLTLDDLLAGRKFADAVVQNAFFPIDIHNPDGVGQAPGTAQRPKPYSIPYGCFVPRDIDGLLLAGRCISGSHEAHASYRNQRITMAMGAAVGIAAALAVRDAVEARDVNVSEVQRLVGIDWSDDSVENTAEPNPNLPRDYTLECTSRA